MFRFFIVSLMLVSGCAGAAPSGAVPSGAVPSGAVPSGAAPMGHAPVAAPSAVRSVDVTTLEADLGRGAVPLLIDVRTPTEFASGHVPGARNVPIDQLEARVGELGSADTEVFVVCQSGGRSARASATLAAKGLRPVNVSGGTTAWIGAGFPVE